MFVTVNCDIKLNLALRVLGRRGDGYHDIYSIFWRRPSPEVVEADFCADCDKLEVTGAEIPGENILAKVCRHIRNICGGEALPPVRIRLHKHLPCGGGLGAGSGNAAAFLRLARGVLGFGGHTALNEAALGADVAFLASDYSLAAAAGIGDDLRCVGGVLDMPSVIFFPAWSVNTADAYCALDEIRTGGGQAMNEKEAADEAESVLERLASGVTVGRIPNDFTDCAGHAEQYALLENLASLAGSAAWGLCGSGSAYFTLFRRGRAVNGMQSLFNSIRERNNQLGWLRQILILE